MEPDGPGVATNQTCNAPDTLSEENTEIREQDIYRIRLCTEEQIKQESEDINVQLFENIYFRMLKIKFKWDAKACIGLLLNNYRYSRLAKEISKIKIPKMARIGLFQADFGNKHFRNFVIKSAPTATEDFSIYKMRREKKLRYLNLLFSRSITKSKQFLMHDFRNINLKQLKRLFVSIKHIDSFAIIDSTFSLPSDLDFSDIFRGTTLKRLTFKSCDITNHDSADESLHTLDSLISGLAKSPDLKKSLESMNISSSRHSNELCEETLAKYGFPVKSTHIQHPCLLASHSVTNEILEIAKVGLKT
ncbi:unnamed protein product [Moneuplotes crassus]|uniref:Uncharacterized protein n=1 Tax=Euplotes crassus TaxID=5936 RepID=A0AAD1X716_EUPCR|nr:unnamed protein product [Moneuplotes crassus]